MSHEPLDPLGSSETAAPTEHRLMVLMFTDLVNSSGLKMQLGDVVYATKVARPHNELFRGILARFPGAKEINYTGDGFLANFAAVSDAVETALLFHEALRTFRWEAVPVRTRIGIHVGEVVMLGGGDPATTFIASHAADMCARLMSLGGGGQTLLTRHAFDDARQYVRAHPTMVNEEPPELAWIAHGRYRFKGRDDDPMEVFEVGAVEHAPLAAPGDGEKARRVLNADEEETLGWRPAAAAEIPGRPGWITNEKIGEGGFGEVWLVRQPKTGGERVFKFCFDPDRLRSLKRELTIFRLIREALGNRDDIARLHDVRLDKAPFYLESEYVPHGNLVQWATHRGGIETVPLTVRMQLMAGICEAVSAAHSVGIIHKDLKPSNVLMREDKTGCPSPVLADFGIGIVTDQSQFAKLGVTETGFTMSLMAANDSSRTGTRMYAPPESLVGKPSTVQSDIFALGVLLYQLAIGDLHRPLATGWERDVPDEIMREDIAAATAGRVNERLHSVKELTDRLTAQPTRRRKLHRRSVTRRTVVALAAAAVLVALAVLGWQAFTKTRINDLTARIQQRIEAPGWTPADLTATDSLVADLAHVSKQKAAEPRRRVTQQLARFTSQAIRRANLTDDDRQQIEQWLALLQPRDAALAAQLSRDLAARLRQWQPAYALQPPFEGDLPESAAKDGDRLRFGQRRVALPVSLSGNTRIEAVFDGIRGLKNTLGFAFDHGGGHAYHFRILPSQNATPTRIALDVRSPDLDSRLHGWGTTIPEAGSLVLEGGKPLLRVERRIDDPENVGVWKRFDGSPHAGKVWLLSFRGRVSGVPANRGDSHVSLRASNRAGKELRSAYQTFRTNTDWTSRTARFEVPSDTVMIELRCSVTKTAGRLEVADLRVIEKEATADENDPGRVIVMQPEREWSPATVSAHRWMTACDDRNVRMMEENGRRFLRLINESPETQNIVVARQRIDLAGGTTAQLSAQVRIPLAVQPGASSWEAPRVLVRALDRNGRQLTEGDWKSLAVTDWTAVSVKRVLPPDTEMVEVAISAQNCKGAIDVADLSCDFSSAQTAAAVAEGEDSPVLLIMRDQTVLRRLAVPSSLIDGESLQISAERSGSFLRLQLGDQRPLEVFDPLPLPARDHRALILTSVESRLRSVTAFKQSLPAQPAPLEVADELFAAGKFGEALAIYEKQTATAGDAGTAGQAQFKLGLCLLQQQRTADAETHFAEAAKSDANPWAVLASCQLLASYLQQKRVDDADAVFQFLHTRRDFAQLAPLVSDQLQHAIFSGYIDRYRASIEVGSSAEWLAGIEKLSQVLEAADPLGIPERDRWALRWHINRFLEATGQTARAIEDARLALERMDKMDLASLDPWPVHFCQSYRRLLTGRGQVERAWDTIQRFDQKAPGDAFALEVIRCLIAMRRIDEADARARSLAGTRPVMVRDKIDPVFIEAHLLLGTIQELRGQADLARETWAAAYRRMREAVPGGHPAEGAANGSRTALINLIFLSSISGEMSDADLPSLRARLSSLYGAMLESGNSPAKALVESLAGMFDRPTLTAIWNSERGGAFARKFIRGEVQYPDLYTLPTVISIEEVLIQGSIGRDGLSAEEEEIYFEVCDQMIIALRDKAVGPPALMGIFASWKGITSLFGWGGTQALLPPKLRVPLTFVLGHRMLRLGNKDEALKMFRAAAEGAAPDKEGAQLRALAQAAIGKASS